MGGCERVERERRPRRLAEPGYPPSGGEDSPGGTKAESVGSSALQETRVKLFRRKAKEFKFQRQQFKSTKTKRDLGKATT